MLRQLFVVVLLFIVAFIVGFCVCLKFCCALSLVLSSFAILFMGKRGLVAILCLFSAYLLIFVAVELLKNIFFIKTIMN